MESSPLRTHPDGRVALKHWKHAKAALRRWERQLVAQGGKKLTERERTCYLKGHGDSAAEAYLEADKE